MNAPTQTPPTHAWQKGKVPFNGVRVAGHAPTAPVALPDDAAGKTQPNMSALSVGGSVTGAINLGALDKTAEMGALSPDSLIELPPAEFFDNLIANLELPLDQQIENLGALKPEGLEELFAKIEANHSIRVFGDNTLYFDGQTAWLHWMENKALFKKTYDAKIEFAPPVFLQWFSTQFGRWAEKKYPGNVPQVKNLADSPRNVAREAMGKAAKIIANRALREYGGKLYFIRDLARDAYPTRAILDGESPQSASVSYTSGEYAYSSSGHSSAATWAMAQEALDQREAALKSTIGSFAVPSTRKTDEFSAPVAFEDPVRLLDTSAPTNVVEAFYKNLSGVEEFDHFALSLEAAARLVAKDFLGRNPQIITDLKGKGFQVGNSVFVTEREAKLFLGPKVKQEETTGVGEYPTLSTENIVRAVLNAVQNDGGENGVFLSVVRPEQAESIVSIRNSLANNILAQAKDNSLLLSPQGREVFIQEAIDQAKSLVAQDGRFGEPLEKALDDKIFWEIVSKKHVAKSIIASIDKSLRQDDAAYQILQEIVDTLPANAILTPARVLKYIESDNTPSWARKNPELAYDAIARLDGEQSLALAGKLAFVSALRELGGAQVDQEEALKNIIEAFYEERDPKLAPYVGKLLEAQKDPFEALADWGQEAARDAALKYRPFKADDVKLTDAQKAAFEQVEAGLQKQGIASARNIDLKPLTNQPTSLTIFGQEYYIGENIWNRAEAEYKAQHTPEALYVENKVEAFSMAADTYVRVLQEKGKQDQDVQKMLTKTDTGLAGSEDLATLQKLVATRLKRAHFKAKQKQKARFPELNLVLNEENSFVKDGITYWYPPENDPQALDPGGAFDQAMAEAERFAHLKVFTCKRAAERHMAGSYNSSPNTALPTSSSNAAAPDIATSPLGSKDILSKDGSVAKDSSLEPQLSQEVLDPDVEEFIWGGMPIYTPALADGDICRNPLEDTRLFDLPKPSMMRRLAAVATSPLTKLWEMSRGGR